MYEKYLLSHKIKHRDDNISRLNVINYCNGANHQSRYCKRKKEVINIDYNSQLRNILDEFLRSNRVSFDQFEVQCGNLVEKANEC